MNAIPASNPHKICYVFSGCSLEKGTVSMTKVPCMEMIDAGGGSFFLPKVEGSAKRTVALSEGVTWQDALSVAGRSRVTAERVILSLREAFSIPAWEDMKPVERSAAIYKPVLTRAEKARMQESIGSNVIPMQLVVNG